MRCVCGYFRADHEAETGKCPLCACGATPAEHRYELVSPGKEELRCPGRGPSEKTGKFALLRRGSYRESAPEKPVAARREPHGKPGELCLCGYRYGTCRLDDEPLENEVAFPAPEHTSRDPWPEGFAKPPAVLRLERAAEAAGVAVLAQYSRGHGMHAAHGRPTSLRHVVGLRLRRPDGSAAYAVYVRAVEGVAAWKWQSIRTPERVLTLKELTEWISTGSTSRH